MSAAGRYAHQQNKNRHNQGKPAGHGKVSETIETATWMSPGMAACRQLAHTHQNRWTHEDYMAIMDVTETEADRQLRKLCSLGFATIAVEREDGKFKRFVFGMENPNLAQ